MAAPTALPLIKDGVPPPKKMVSTIGFLSPCHAATCSSSAAMASIHASSSMRARTWELKSH
jgi:hypothetical protein